MSMIRPIKLALIAGMGMSLSLSLSLPVYAASYQTYVIDTYGGASLLPAVSQQLSSSADGGSVAVYQDKLVLRTTASNYQAVQSLLAQIDQVPQSLSIAVRVGSRSDSSGSIQQGQVVIGRGGVQITGNVGSYNQQHQQNSLYQVTTLSGSAASISTGQLLSMAQNYIGYTGNRYGTPSGIVVIQGWQLVPTTQGIAVTPRTLPNGQIQVALSQVDEQPNQSIYSNNTRINTQSLNTTITLNRGQWVTIGSVTGTTQNARTGSSYQSQTSYPIQIKVD